MTLIKSILLGSAAGIVAVASAQAADLPTRKAAPVVQYVKICNVGGITGWTMPGSDTCMKVSGYMTAQFTGGNLNNQFNYAGSVINSVYANALPAGSPVPVSQRILVEGNNGTVGLTNGVTGAPITGPGSFGVDPTTGRIVFTPGKQLTLTQANGTFNRPVTGWSARAALQFDFASNTAYGPLLAHIGIQADMGNGFDPLNGNTGMYCDQCYLTWAGITAGKAASFYSFVGGGDNWANFFSPDQKGFNEPMLLAYTASFGGGFSATIAAQSPGSNGNSGGGTDFVGPNTGLAFGGQRWPDIVGQLHVKQGWGEAQLSGVLHDVNVYDPTNINGTSCGEGLVRGVLVTGNLGCNAQKTQTGWGIDAGVKILLPSFGQDDAFLVTGSYTQSAVWYSGLPDGMWGENGQVNGNGQPMFLSDAYFNPLTNQWSKPTAWTISALLEHHFTPQFYIDLEGSYGKLTWSNQGGGCNIFFGLAACTAASIANGALSPSATSWIIGADIGWNPVTNLNFDLELMYQDTNQQRPSGFIGTVYSTGVFVPGAWEGNSSGFAGRFRITRYF